VAATTENPSFSVVAPLLSRSLILQLRPLTSDDIRTVVQRAIDDSRGLGGQVAVRPEAVDLLVQMAAGDARRALTALEVAAEAVQGQPVTVEAIEQSLDEAAVRYDRDGDQHYDVVSAFIKSVRGSDVDAALHYLARMLVAGEDPRFVARRLLILASEDIGMADPTALQTAVAAAQTVALIGMPEAQLTLAHATIHLATAPKSNAVTTALAAAMDDIKAGKAGLVPAHLRDGHYSGAAALGNAQGYKYSHNDPDGVVAQQYPPDELVDVDYYRPTGRGNEREMVGRLDRLRAIIRRKRRRP
jgi:putative ATPase